MDCITIDGVDYCAEVSQNATHDLMIIFLLVILICVTVSSATFLIKNYLSQLHPLLIICASSILGIHVFVIFSTFI